MKLVLFGTEGLSSLTWHSVAHDGTDEPVAFAVEAAWRRTDRLHDLPVVDFETLEERFGPGDHGLLVPIGARGMNALRRRIVGEGRRRGYRLPGFRSSRALMPRDLVHGVNVIVHEGAIVQPFAVLGDNVTIRSGAVVSHHVVIEDDVFVAASATIGGGARIGSGSFVGLGAVIRDGVSVGAGCLIGAGAVVVGDTEPDGVYLGVPARRGARPAHMIEAP